MTVAEKLRLLAEFAETGEEFKINGVLCVFNKNTFNCLDEHIANGDVSIKGISNSIITRLPFKPNHGERYYFIDVSCNKGFSFYTSTNDKTDSLILSRETVYRTEAEAIAEVERRGWKVC